MTIWEYILEFWNKLMEMLKTAKVPETPTNTTKPEDTTETTTNKPDELTIPVTPTGKQFSISY